MSVFEREIECMYVRERVSVLVCMCQRERERDGDRVSVSVRVCFRERGVWVYVCFRGRESEWVHVCVWERDRERARVSVCVRVCFRERECRSLCVSVCVFERESKWVCVWDRKRVSECEYVCVWGGGVLEGFSEGDWVWRVYVCVREREWVCVFECVSVTEKCTFHTRAVWLSCLLLFFASPVLINDHQPKPLEVSLLSSLQVLAQQQIPLTKKLSLGANPIKVLKKTMVLLNVLLILVRLHRLQECSEMTY